MTISVVAFAEIPSSDQFTRISILTNKGKDWFINGIAIEEQKVRELYGLGGLHDITCYKLKIPEGMKSPAIGWVGINYSININKCFSTDTFLPQTLSLSSVDRFCGFFWIEEERDINRRRELVTHKLYNLLLDLEMKGDKPKVLLVYYLIFATLPGCLYAQISTSILARRGWIENEMNEHLMQCWIQFPPMVQSLLDSSPTPPAKSESEIFEIVKKEDRINRYGSAV